MEEYKYSEHRKKEYIKEIEIDNKEEYYWDILNIEHSFSGRMDTPMSNAFIMESVQLIINSMELFEKGYFDCAYYSLRQAIEISTTIVYLADISEEERKEKYNNWKNTKQFPMQSHMLQKLYKDGMVVSDMQVKMKEFFENISDINKRINKYVHKQGLQNFYVSRNHPINQKKDDKIFIDNFKYFLKEVIGIVAVMRLAIDPYPVLLMDEEVLLRCFDSMTEAYSEEFVNKYISKKTVEDYKKTDIYINSYNSHMQEEKKNEYVFQVMKYQCIDTTKKKEILKQLHLLSFFDICASLMAFSCDKIVKVYSCGGLMMYFTDRETNRKSHSWSGADFVEFEKSIVKYNQKYDEVYISVFEILNPEKKEELFFIEHNEQLDDNDIRDIEDLKGYEPLSTEKIP